MTSVVPEWPTPRFGPLRPLEMAVALADRGTEVGNE